jgi:hypothetical protein
VPSPETLAVLNVVLGDEPADEPADGWSRCCSCSTNRIPRRPIRRWRRAPEPTATVAALMHETPDAYATGGAPFDTDTKVGIAVRKDNPALKSALDKAVQAIVADGTYAALIKKWTLPPASSAF